MKGYKALDKDMKEYKIYNKDMNVVYGGTMQFELGKTYFVDGEIAPYKNGFHFCDKIEKLCICHQIVYKRIFEVEAEGDIVTYNESYVAKTIKLIRELTKQEISGYFRENWEKLCESENANIRIAVAEQGYGLDKLINDEVWAVRYAVAEQGYGLDRLISDKSNEVRTAVARQGYGLDKLIDDEDWFVRAEVVKQGYVIPL